MGITTINNGINQAISIRYSAITDSSVDWTGITNSTYFYDKDTRLPYYKNSGGTVVSLFEEGGSGGSGSDTFVTGGTYTSSASTITLDRNDGNSVSISGITSGSGSDTFVTGGTYSGSTIVLNRNDGNSVDVTGITSSNFANTNLTLDGDRDHELDSNKLTIRGTTTSANSRIENIFVNPVVGGIVQDHYDKFSTLFHSLNRDSFGNTAAAVAYHRGGLDVGDKKKIELRAISTGTASYMLFSDQFSGAYTKIGANVPHYFLAAAGALATHKFIVGDDAVIGSEDISLQGDTLISKKLELSTTDDGFLMPRLTTAQKNAISSPDTNLMVFDTDLSGLQRYNGSAWVNVSDNTFVTGGTYTSSASTITLDRNDGNSVSISGITSGSGSDTLYTADGTLSGARAVNLDGNNLTFNSGSGGNVEFNGGLSATTISATTYTGIDKSTVEISAQKDSSGTINKGQVVRLSDYDIVADVTTVELADNSSGTTMPAIGIATSSIGIASTGTVVVFGKATGLNTNSLSLGDVYVSTSGNLTNTKPTGTSIVQRIGKVTRVSSTVGEIIVFGGGMDNVNSSTADYVRTSIVSGGLAASYASADQVVPMTVQSENSNTDKFTMTSNGIRVNQAGRYRVNCGTTIASTGTQRANPIMKITVNNNIAQDANNQDYQSSEHYARNAGSSNTSTSSLDIVLDLAVNDIVRIILAEGGVSGNSNVNINSTGTFLELSEMVAGVVTPVTGTTKVLVKGGMSANQTVGNTTPIVEFVTTGTTSGVEIDVNGEWDNANHKFTVGASGAGTYFVQGQVFLDNSNGWSHLFLYKNGSVYAPFAGFGTASGWDNLDGTIPIDLIVGDYIDIRIYSSVNGTINFASWGDRQAFSITKVSGFPPPGGTDINAVHTNVSGEIIALTEKTSVANTDEVIIEESDGTKKSMKRRNFVAPITTSVASTATLTVDSDATDMAIITAQAATLTIAAPTGTPGEGLKLFFRIKDDGTTRTINLNAIFRDFTGDFPTATTASKELYFACKYDAVATKWDILAWKILP